MREYLQAIKSLCVMSVMLNFHLLCDTLDTFPICPSLEYFSLIKYEDLECPDAVLSVAGKYTASPIKQVDSSQLVKKMTICTCQQKKMRKYCFKRFFDSDYKEYAEATVEPTRQHCESLCQEVLKSGKSEMIHGKEPEYKCWWMKGTLDEKFVTTVRLVKVKGNVATQTIFDQFLVNGECKWNDISCRFQGGAYVIFLQSAQMNIKTIQDDLHLPGTFESRRIDGTNFLIVRDVKTRAVYNIEGCCLDFADVCFSPSVRGYLFDTSDFKDFFINPPPVCESNSMHISPPLAINVIKDKEADELIQEENICHLTKTVLLNAVAVGTPIDTRLLSVFNTHYDSKTHRPMYYLSNKHLIRANCTLQSYTHVMYRCPDIWLIYDGSNEIGCYDARARIAFTGKCRCYNLTTVYYIMGKYVIDNSNGTLIPRVNKYPESQIIYELNLLAEGYKDLVTFLQTPTGVIIYEDPILKEQKENDMFNQEYARVDMFGALAKWLSQLSSWFWIALAIVLLVVVIYSVVTCIRCNRKRRRRSDSASTPLLTLITDRSS